MNTDGAYFPRQLPPRKSKHRTRISVDYTFSDGFGVSEVKYAFDRSQRFILTNGQLLAADELKPGMEFWLEGGAIAKVAAVAPPVDCLPPSSKPDQNGNAFRRVIGKIKHTGFYPRIDFGVAGTKIETTPGHPFWSVDRQAWVMAGELRTGEYVQNQSGYTLPIEWISPVRFEFCELYNVEVEDLHTYFVGGGNTGGIWSHNGLSDGCRIAKPAEVEMTTPGGKAIPKYNGGKTSGVLAAGGTETVLLSGYAGPSKGVKGIPQMNGNIKSHVEAHAATLMRKQGLEEATLYINRVPCLTKDPRSLGCADAIPHMLPEKARLRVIGPDGYDQLFVGLPDPPTARIRGL